MCSGVFTESDTNMDQYQAIVDELNQEIAQLTIRRDGCEPGSARQLKIQRQLNAVADEQEAWIQQAPALTECDAAIRDMTTRVNHAQGRLLDTTRAGGRTTAGTGGAGLLLLALSFAWLPTGWLPTVGILLLGVAGLIWWITSRVRGGLSDELYQAQDMLTELTSDRAAQLPGVGGERRVWKATRVDAQVFPGQVDASGAGADGGLDPVGDGATRLLGGSTGERHHVLGEFNGDHGAHDATWGRR